MKWDRLDKIPFPCPDPGQEPLDEEAQEIRERKFPLGGTMSTQKTFETTIAILRDARVGHQLLDIQVGVCLGESRLSAWTRDLGAARQALRVTGWIVGQANALAFAAVGDDPIVEAPTPELALIIAALLNRKAELLEQG